jgi:hypothetical protein
MRQIFVFALNAMIVGHHIQLCDVNIAAFFLRATEIGRGFETARPVHAIVQHNILLRGATRHPRAPFCHFAAGLREYTLRGD